MNIALDIILVAIAAVIIFLGWRRGLVKSVIGLVCSVVSVIVAYALTPTVSGWLANSVFIEKISSGIESTVKSAASTSIGTDVSVFLSKIPETLSGTLDKYNVEDGALKEFVSGLSDTGESAVSKISEFIAKPTSWKISNAIAFIGLFVVAFILLRLASKLIIVLFKAPVIRTVDHAAGLALGIVTALIVLWVLSLVLSAGVSALESVLPENFKNTVNDSVILKFFSNYNPISVIKNVTERIGS